MTVIRFAACALSACLLADLGPFTLADAGDGQADVILGWRAEIVRCERRSEDSIVLYLRASGSLVNQSRNDLIVPSRQFSAGMDIASNPVGTPPWNVDWSQNNEGMSSATREVTESPDARYFQILKPNEKVPIVATDAVVLFADRTKARRAEIPSVGIRLYLGLGSTGDEPDNVLLRMEQSARWQRIGVTVPSHRSTPWVRLDLPKDCRP